MRTENITSVASRGARVANDITEYLATLKDIIYSKHLTSYNRQGDLID